MGNRARRSFTSSGPPMTWMLLTKSSTSPGLPAGEQADRQADGDQHPGMGGNRPVGRPQASLQQVHGANEGSTDQRAADAHRHNEGELPIRKGPFHERGAVRDAIDLS